MSFIDDLKRRLTTPGGEAFSQDRLQRSRPEYVGQAPSGQQSSDVKPPVLFDVLDAARRRRRRLIRMGAVLLAVFLVSGGTFGAVRWYREARTVQKHHVRLIASGPDRVTSGDEVTVRLALENQSRVPWENVVLRFQIPDGFRLKSSSPRPTQLPGSPAGNGTREILWDLGLLPPRASQELVVSGQLIGEEGAAAIFTADVALVPGNRPGTRVEKSVFASVSLESIPVDVSVDVPRGAASGTPITVRIVYQNRTGKDLVGSRLVLETPQGFSVRSTIPPIQGRELAWDLSPVSPQGQGEVSVAGIIEGEPESVKPFRASVGFVLPDGKFLAQRSVQRSLTIERAALSLTQLLNTKEDTLKVNPGAEVTGVVRYKNTGTGGLREVIVRLSFEGVGIDESAIKVQGGFYDGRKKEIIWSAASSPQLRALRPGESGELTYAFRILPLPALPLGTETTQNFSLITRAVGDSPDLPTPPGAPKQVVSDQFEIFLNTVPTIRLDAFADDGRAGLPASTGPLPPQVGQETLLTVRARVGNTSNEVVDGTYRTVLPESVRWVGKEYHTTGEARFNERTREVAWTIPLLPARAGIVFPEPEFAFQVGITPSLNQVGSEVALTRGHLFEGTDAFTTVRVRAEAEAVTTKAVDPEKSQVVR